METTLHTSLRLQTKTAEQVVPKKMKKKKEPKSGVLSKKLQQILQTEREFMDEIRLAPDCKSKCIDGFRFFLLILVLCLLKNAQFRLLLGLH